LKTATVARWRRPAVKHIDWQIPDPRNMEPEDFNNVRDQIGQLVQKLIEDSTKQG
jgi:protein-tyrosine-phosphatase